MKKVILGLAAAAFTCLVSAQGFAQPSDIIGVDATSVAHVEISSLCPMGAMCITNGVQVELSFLIPCAGEIGPVSSRVIKGEDGKQKLLVSAVAITTEASTLTRCFAQSYATEILSLPNLYITKEDIIDLNSRK